MKRVISILLILVLIIPTIALANNNDFVDQIIKQKEEDKKKIIACSLLGLYQSLGALAVIIVYNRKSSVKK